MRRTLVHLCLALATTALGVQAAPGGKHEQVLFAPGKTSKTVSTTIEGKNLSRQSADHNQPSLVRQRVSR